ncbi:Flavin-containing monooxygenase FMO GS-OX-like 2 [Holothuria leucospilota]|uniref:Flavin-containing monooxygenase n=1 Tax=Holothuria leucospilota TaxID=206669 RepID=A0A9Q1HH11_HOLLE|nr:Flavin-containing monooxygenase FMO GS-OX-like 2 [Holothuria leucospilota]
MYQNLKTNLPKEVMAFPDFPFKTELPSFLGHTDVREYLEDYANHFGVFKYIKFFTRVESVKPIKTDVRGKEKWEFKVRDVCNKDSSKECSIFDAVIVCNGHYSVPYSPDVPGLDTFTGIISHSHTYRAPDPYQGKIVAVIGGGLSGMDISLDVAKCAQKVFLCHWRSVRFRENTKLPTNMEEAMSVESIKNGNIVVLQDGKEKLVDAILFCTGYEYCFPFLTPECKVTQKNKHIQQLYLHLIHMIYPSMSFIGIAYRICPFPQFMYQVEYALKVLEGTVPVPSIEEMESVEKCHLEELLADGMPEKLFHFLGSKQWGYNDRLAELGGFEPLAPFVRHLFDHVDETRGSLVMGYKEKNYELVGDWWKEKGSAE